MNNTPYVPVKEDFQFLPDRDITTDQNFASQGYWKGVAISFFRNKRAVAGLVIVALIMFFAIFGPMMSSYSYKDIISVTSAEGKQIVAKGIGPQISGVLQGSGQNTELFTDHTFLFGTDDVGRDLWTRTWDGARISLIIAFVTIVIDMIIGMSYGLISGFFGGMVDNIMQRIVEISNSVPRLVIVSVLAIFMPKGMFLVIVALLLTEWIGMSKISRAEMLKLKEQEYVLASRTLGAGSFHIIFRQILPNAGVIHAIRGVNLLLKKGETVAIVGESGSGKSVTMKAACGLLDSNAVINSGQVLYTYAEGDGPEQTVDLLKLSKKQLRKTINGNRIAMVFQDPMTSLDPTMQIGKQIMESMILYRGMSKADAWKRSVELLELVGITDAEKRMKNYPHQLSGGMRQRVVIAIALSGSPDILICDEPTTALDVTIQAKILELIKEVQDRLALSVIYITHDLGVVAKVADYVNVMYAGKIVEVGKVDEIFYEPAHPYTWGLLSAMPDLDTDDDRLYSIPGSPPNLLHEPQGDAFTPRNAFAMRIDEKEAPPLFKISDTHYAATWLLHPDAPKVELPEGLRARLERARKEAEKYL